MVFHSAHTCVLSSIVECMTAALHKNKILTNVIELKHIEENYTAATQRAESILANNAKLQVVVCNAMGAYHVGIATTWVSLSSKTLENRIFYCQINDADLRMKLSHLITPDARLQKSENNS